MLQLPPSAETEFIHNALTWHSTIAYTMYEAGKRAKLIRSTVTGARPQLGAVWSASGGVCIQGYPVVRAKQILCYIDVFKIATQLIFCSLSCNFVQNVLFLDILTTIIYYYDTR